MLTKQDLINFELKMVEHYKNGKLPFLFHLSGGNEDQLINIFKEIKEGDYVLSSHRNHYHALLHGIPADVLEQKILDGKSMFVYDRKRNFFTSAIIGGTPAIAAGIALALKRKGSKQKVWCFVGDGTEDSGHLFEAARYVEGFDLPCTFIVENNNRSVTTTLDERWGSAIDPIMPKCVIKYKYNITYPHARSNDMIDLKKQQLKKDDEYFPKLQNENITYDECSDVSLTYKEAVIKGSNLIAANNGVFIGYNVANGDAMGTLKDVPKTQKIETPVAENLMVGLAIGMSFEGFRPVVYFERHDFMLVAADAIINHVNYIERLSHGEYTVPVIIRAVTADSGPFYSGPTHSQDFTNLFYHTIDNNSMPLFSPTNGQQMLNCYNLAVKSNRPCMIIERKSYY